MSARKVLRVALAGNPNSGKTTIFNALTGARQKVGNYPGVTVEKREGGRRRGEVEYRFIDLPGIYSLTAYSIDEVVTRDFLLDERPDLIVDVLDSTNLERHLYLCLQFQELGIPVVGALNMSDEAEAKGIRVDAEGLGSVLGIPFVKTTGPKGEGIEALLDAVDRVAGPDAAGTAPLSGPPAASGGGTAVAAGSAGAAERRVLRYGEELESRLVALEGAIRADADFAARYPARWLAVKLLEKDDNAKERLAAHRDAAAIGGIVVDSTAWIERHYGKDAEIVVSEQRYGYIRGATREAVKIVRKPDFSLTEAVDKVVMNGFLALPIFVGVLWSVFTLTFALGEYPMGWIESGLGWLSGAISGAMADGPLKALLVDGIIGGVGGVLSFVPLIVILFFLLSLLEDVGYMSRAAFATDKLLHAFGLHGQSIFPMMLGFGCSVPAIMAARTLKSPRDRIVTILVIPFMSCGAKLPVHVLLAAAFFPENAAAIVMLIYGIGVALALLSAMVLKRTILKGEPTPFVMELPPYRAPTLGGILWHVGDKTWQYAKKAGTVILAASVLIWAITTFPAYEPDDAELGELRAAWAAEHPGATPEEAEAGLETLVATRSLETSLAGRLGGLIEPAFRPLGFDWRVAAATVTGFAAKETVVSTLGILYRVGTEETEESQGLRDALRKDPNWSPLVAFAFMVFTLVIPPCFAALAAIRAELGWRWLGFAFGFMFALGWILSFGIFQLGSLFGRIS